MKKLILFFSLFVSYSYAQTITVDDTNYSSSQLVDLLLRGSCVGFSNVSSSSGQAVAYFNNNNGAFPINEGIVIRSGRAKLSEGTYNPGTGDVNLSSQLNTNGDSYLQAISNANQQTGNITDVAFLEFDFIPISNSFSFDFLFASNEYGQYQCQFSDIFAFQLIDLTTNQFSNLAVIPGSSTPVSVRTIRNSLYNSGCNSNNPTFFGAYHVNNPSNATLNMRGNTVVMSASSAVVPNRSYRIRLAIGDYQTSGYDSAVFIKAGSFNTNFSLGNDQVLCTGNNTILNTNLDSSFAHRWFKNGVSINGETTSTLTTNGPGTYSVEVTKGTCVLMDDIVISELTVNNPQNLFNCNTGASTYNYNLTLNNETTLGINPTNFDIFYYTSLANANNDIRITNPATFNSAPNQTIYLRIFNSQTNEFCTAVYNFDLLLTNGVNAANSVTSSVCESALGTTFNLSSLNTQILNGSNSSSYTITFHNTLADATTGSNDLPNTLNIPQGTTSVSLFARMEDVSNSSCFDTTIVTITVNPAPMVSQLTDVQVCSSYMLPVITSGNYFTGINGTGMPLNAGDQITDSGTYYIYLQNANGCSNQSEFNVYIVEDYVVSLDNCGSFTVPTPPYNIGNFYTGPNATGTLVSPGTVYTNNTQSPIVQTLYFNASLNNSFCVDRKMDINIFPVPIVDILPDVTYCTQYALPPLANGIYFTQSSAQGTQLNPGDLISTTSTIYVFNANTNNGSNGPFSCFKEDSFQVNIVDPTQFTTINSCATYTLPAITFGGYYSQPNGNGSIIDPSIPITNDTVVYYYANTTLLPNCTANLSYTININPLPPVDQVQGGTFCGEFVLPPLTNGDYFKLAGGPTTPNQVAFFAGQVIDLTGTKLDPGTYYIWNGPDANGCSNEYSFDVQINPYPALDGVLDRTECLPYSIPAPVNGTLYTQTGGPNGGGSVVSPTDIFNTTRTFYLYNINPITNCSIERSFTVFYNGLNLPTFNTLNVCEQQNYVLPSLTHVPPSPFNYTIGYFYNQNGTNPVPNGTVFNTPNTSTTIYVYATNGDRIICTEEKSFVINVSQTPNLVAPVYDNEVCGSFTLPVLPMGNYQIGYYTNPNGVGLIDPTNYTFNNIGNTSITQTVYMYAFATNNPNCFDEVPITFTVHPFRDITINGGYICVDSVTNQVIQSLTLASGLNPAEYTVTWTLNGTVVATAPSFTATQAGVYTVSFQKLTPDAGNACNYNATTVEVMISGPAVATYEVSPSFDESSFISVNISSGLSQEYQYQLVYPNGALSQPQSSNNFQNLDSGTYFVNIIDVRGNCNPTRIGPIYIVNYPLFFTPNSDGFNETWNIKDLAHQTEAVISIFDRYGKLIKQIKPSGNGWDGTFNDTDLPSTDYWFVVDYFDQNSQQKLQYKAHFTLKR